MNLDSLLPIAPARVRALVLPLGQIRNDQFAGFVERLRRQYVVHLQDVTPDPRPNRNMFSPLAYPKGAILYELVTYMPPPSHLSLSPFDLYREPLVIIAIVDGKELGETTFSKRQSLNGARVSVMERNVRALEQELEALRDDYGRALVHQVLLFDYEDPPGHKITMPHGIISIPPTEKCKRTTMKSVMCEISSLLLADMTTLAKQIGGMALIDSPGQISTSRQMNGASWGLDDKNGLSRRNSQHGSLVNSRSSSASGLVDRSHVRMSMPPVPFKSSPTVSSSSTPARPSTPVKSSLSNPPTTFETISGGQESGPPTPEQSSTRPDTGDEFRMQTQDKVSVQGFGPGSANERFRNKGKARVAVVIGSIYLQAGRWSDALKQLSEGATMARTVNDHVWHGKALELIVLTLFLLAWSDLEFTVPMVCYPPQEKGAPNHVPTDAETADPKQLKQLRNLQVVLPELLERIIGLYSRISSENLPPLPLSEAIIRFCKILSALHLCDGLLGKRALEMMVLGTPPSKIIGTAPRLTVIPSRQDITKLLFRAFPSSASELLTTVDRTTILSGIAAVLGPLGHHRKKAMVIRELIAVLIGGLVEARTRGAADVGIHPAAGLVALQTASGHPSNTGSVALELQEGDIEQGVDAFLSTLVQTYGIVSFDPSDPLSQPEKYDDSDDAVVARIQKQSIARFFSIPSVKISMLRACINFSEALPDFNGVLKYSSDLLRTAGSGVAPGPRKEDASAILSRDEQVRLMTNISKTHALSKRLGFDHLFAEYWDEFLVRGVALDPLPSNKTPIPHPKSDLPGAATVRTSQDVNPFIYNPFLKPPDKAAVEQTLVVGEAATFKVTLQNPFDVEVDVEKITLDAEGAEFESVPESTLIGPYRTQILKVSGIPKACGPLKLSGAIVQVRGCRERRFPIFTEPWVPENDVKPKAVGIAALEKSLALTGSISPLKPSHLGLKVIPEQPLVAVKSSTLPQSCVMILEGERQSFSVTLENLSKTTPVDFMLFSFEDSTQDPLQTALKNKDSTPSEIYEYELILMKKQALKLRKNQGKRFIAPNSTATFDFEVFGKPGLTSAFIQIDYAHLGVPPEEVADQFYTRSVSVQLTVTVNASVELSRYDILPVLDEIPPSLWSRVSSLESEPPLAKDQYCLLSLDLINAWPSNMLVRLEGADGVEAEDYILPGNTSRVILPVRRIFLDDPHAAVPSLNSSNRRQFVVSASHISPDFERGVREAFWYKENILDNLKATWKTLSGPTRTGTIELRGIRLTNRMIDAIKVEDIGISLSVEDPNDAEGYSDSGRSVVFVDEFVQIKVHICNRTSRPIYPLLRLMPALCHRPPNVALDLSKKFAWNGTLQQVLPLLQGKSSTDVVLGVTALCRGQFEIMASVEETMLWEDEEEPGKKDAEKKEGTRERSDTQTLMDKALGKKERRVWHAREACIIHVKERKL